MCLIRNISIVLICLDHVLMASSNISHPKIGLVLSGGGARGAAHLGIMKTFEKHHIPIDAIVGTSMGAFIGGLYLSGISSLKIERILETTPWYKIIGQDYVRKDIPFRRKTLQREFASQAKIGIDKDNDLVISLGLFKRQGLLEFLKHQTSSVQSITDFDKLKIPFRAVENRLKNGKQSLWERVYWLRLCMLHWQYQEVLNLLLLMEICW